MAKPARKPWRLFALYHLQTGFCRRRELVKEQLDAIAADLSIDLGWEGAVYGSGALAVLVHKVGILNGMFFELSCQGAERASKACEGVFSLFPSLGDFIDRSRDVEGWNRLYLFLSPESPDALDPESVPVLPTALGDLEGALGARLAEKQPGILALDIGRRFDLT